jgi:hypothetical protein
MERELGCVSFHLIMDFLLIPELSNAPSIFRPVEMSEIQRFYHSLRPNIYLEVYWVNEDEWRDAIVQSKSSASLGIVVKFTELPNNIDHEEALDLAEFTVFNRVRLKKQRPNASTEYYGSAGRPVRALTNVPSNVVDVGARAKVVNGGWSLPPSQPMSGTEELELALALSLSTQGARPGAPPVDQKADAALSIALQRSGWDGLNTDGTRSDPATVARLKLNKQPLVLPTKLVSVISLTPDPKTEADAKRMLEHVRVYREQRERHQEFLAAHDRNGQHALAVSDHVALSTDDGPPVSEQSDSRDNTSEDASSKPLLDWDDGAVVTWN